MTESSLSSIVSVGPLSVPLWGIILIASYFGGLVALRIALRSEPEIRREIADRVSTAALIDVLIWKLAPIIANPGIVLERPLYLLYATGGTVAALTGGAAAVAYIAISTRRWWSRKDVRYRIRGMVSFAAVAITLIAVGSLLPDSGFRASGSTSVTDRNDASGRPVAPEFALFDLSGHQHALSDYRGRTVILNFWASWCPPCRTEIPVLIDYVRVSDPDEVLVLSINQTASESSLEALEAYAESEGISYPILLDGSNRVFTDYGVRGIPVTYVVDPDGTISARRTGVVTHGWLRRND